MAKDTSNDPCIRELTPKGQSVAGFFNPFAIFFHLYTHRDLIYQLTAREVAARYKGSVIGIGWSVIQPLLMLMVYTFVFSVIFNAKWGTDPDESRAVFTLVLFMGMITFSIFAEVVNTSPNIVLAHMNFVKKVVFPLEVLVVVRLFSTIINACFSLLVLLAGIIIINRFLPVTALLLPVVWLPLFLFTCGCGYFLASFGVFIRDLEVGVGIFTTMLFFLTPIFYPVRAVPDSFRVFCTLNPLAMFVEESRAVVLYERLPDPAWFCMNLILSVFIFAGGFIWFMKTKKGFADVV